MAKRSDIVQHATVELAGVPVREFSRREHRMWSGWYYKSREGKWIGAYETRRAAVSDALTFELGEAK